MRERHSKRKAGFGGRRYDAEVAPVGLGDLVRDVKTESETLKARAECSTFKRLKDFFERSSRNWITGIRNEKFEPAIVHGRA